MNNVSSSRWFLTTQFCIKIYCFCIFVTILFYLFELHTFFFPWIYVKSIWQPDVSSVSNLSIQINLKDTLGLENGRKKYCNKYSVLWIPKGHYIWWIFSLLWFIYLPGNKNEIYSLHTYIDNWLGTPVIRHVGVLYHISRTVHTRAHSKCSIIRKKSCICGNYQKGFFKKN